MALLVAMPFWRRSVSPRASFGVAMAKEQCKGLSESIGGDKKGFWDGPWLCWGRLMGKGRVRGRLYRVCSSSQSSTSSKSERPGMEFGLLGGGFRSWTSTSVDEGEGDSSHGKVKGGKESRLSCSRGGVIVRSVEGRWGCGIGSEVTLTPCVLRMWASRRCLKNKLQWGHRGMMWDYCKDKKEICVLNKKHNCEWCIIERIVGMGEFGFVTEKL